MKRLLNATAAFFAMVFILPLAALALPFVVAYFAYNESDED